MKRQDKVSIKIVNYLYLLKSIQLKYTEKKRSILIIYTEN